MTRLDLERAIDTVDKMASAAGMEIDRGELEAAKVSLKVIRDLVNTIRRLSGLSEPNESR